METSCITVHSRQRLLCQIRPQFCSPVFGLESQTIKILFQAEEIFFSCLQVLPLSNAGENLISRIGRADKEIFSMNKTFANQTSAFSAYLPLPSVSFHVN
jgi:hypothetical protein